MGSPTKPPRKKLRCFQEEGPDLASEPILIRVGEEGSQFYVHEKMLRVNSDFFENALSREWKESKDREVKVFGASAELFRIWIKWIYTGRVYLRKLDDEGKDKNGRIIWHQEIDRWRACYAMGSFLQDQDFADALIDYMIEALLNTDSYYDFIPLYIYTTSRKSSNHRKLAVDLFITCWDRKDFESIKDDDKYDEHEEQEEGTENEANDEDISQGSEAEGEEGSADSIEDDEDKGRDGEESGKGQEGDELYTHRFPRSFLLDVIAAIGPRLERGIKKQKFSQFLDLKDTCRYHDHGGPDKICYKNKPAYRF